jgi:hypothetical protein
METILTLIEHGVSAGDLMVEYQPVELVGGKLDLVVDPPDGAVIEFKYPRDSRTGFSPDTMTLGELLRDFRRVASVPAREHWVVQALNPRLQRYLINLEHRHRLRWPLVCGQTFEIQPSIVAGLPGTATKAIGLVTMAQPATGRCVSAQPIDNALSLFAYQIAGPAPREGPDPMPPATATTAEPTDRRTREGARQEILAAAAAVTTRSGSPAFSLPDIIAEMHRRGTGYADSTIRTMISSHMCADAHGPGISEYNDLERIDRGTYRLRVPPPAQHRHG